MRVAVELRRPHCGSRRWSVKRFLVVTNSTQAVHHREEEERDLRHHDPARVSITLAPTSCTLPMWDDAIDATP